jgi:hypothetical protein
MTTHNNCALIAETLKENTQPPQKWSKAPKLPKLPPNRKHLKEFEKVKYE